MIGGKPAQLGLFPFMAALTWTAGGGKKSHCSGFIVSPTAIMAAAHCLHISNDDTLLEANYTANVGSLDRTKGTLVELQAFINPKYNQQTHHNDISILRPLRGGKLPIGENVRSIALEGHLVKPEVAIAMGWGKTTPETCVSQSGGESSRFLLYHPQQIKRLKRKKVHVQGIRTSTCMGDSGSPLVLKRNGEYVAFAILSAGTTFGREYYTRIRPQKKFILTYAPDVKFV